MNKIQTNIKDRDAIIEVMKHYLKGAKSGKGEDMKPAFHKDATIFGYVGNDLFAGPIDQFYAWSDENGPAHGLQVEVADIDISETAATARLEIDDWTGYRFTDMFTFLKIDGQWKIMNKVFHLHA